MGMFSYKTIVFRMLEGENVVTKVSSLTITL